MDRDEMVTTLRLLGYRTSKLGFFASNGLTSYVANTHAGKPLWWLSITVSDDADICHRDVDSLEPRLLAALYETVMSDGS